uniref:Uncharacterized protein n=1 Tax=Lactuca sativa TaxID=4236 RepID=A0A9R1XP50_LACSA|nr:hypothetical protein LSAT_V11C400168660 [Lactuca sativa]
MTSLFDVLLGSNEHDPDLILIYGPMRRHLVFPAWCISYTEMTKMMSDPIDDVLDDDDDEAEDEADDLTNQVNSMLHSVVLFG